MSEITVALLSTTASDAPGSMAIFAETVERSLRRHAPEFRLLPVSLCDPAAHPATRLGERLRLLKNSVIARRRSGKTTADVYHLLDASFAYMIGQIPWARAVVSVHDLIPALQIDRRDLGGPPGWASKRLIRSSLSRISDAGAVHCVSECTANDLRALAGRPADAVIPNPLRPMPKANPDRSTMQGVGVSRFVLNVGNNAVYKNRRGAAEIFDIVRRTHADLHLVLAGPAPDAALRSLVDSFGLTSQVHFAVEPDDQALADLYAHAELLLFPSLYEGFGWPPLEAGHFGCPVVCSNVASLPEVMGDAALFCDPLDQAGFAAAVARLLSDQTLVHDLTGKARENLERFNDRHLALGLAQLYRKLASRSDGRLT